MAWLGAAFGAAGSILGGQSSQKAGKAGQMAKEYEASDLAIQAGQTMAVAERNALQEDRHAKLISSRLLALQASGGGSASDPSSVKLAADVAGEGAYRKAMALYNGEAEARRLGMSADLARYEGTVIKKGGMAQSQLYGLQGTGYLLKGASDLYTRYSGSPATTTPDYTYEGGSATDNAPSGVWD